MRKVRLAIMISGRGSNMEALIEACAAPDYPARVVCVLSNRPEASGLDVARQRGIETCVIDHRTYGKDRVAHDRAVDHALHAAAAELVCLAGYMRVLTPDFVSTWSGRMLNIHPSLLPRYPGLHTHRRALEAGDHEHGATVHLVTAGVDEGPIIAQTRIDVRPDDTEASLSARLLAHEHALYPAALKQFITEKGLSNVL